MVANEFSPGRLIKSTYLPVCLSVCLSIFKEVGQHHFTRKLYEREKVKMCIYFGKLLMTTVKFVMFNIFSHNTFYILKSYI